MNKLFFFTCFSSYSNFPKLEFPQTYLDILFCDISPRFMNICINFQDIEFKSMFF